MVAALRIAGRYFDGQSAAAHSVWIEPALDRLILRLQGDGHVVAVWSVADLRRRGTLEEHGNLILTLTSSPDARLILADREAVAMLAEFLPDRRLSARRWGVHRWLTAIAASVAVLYGLHLFLRFAPAWVAPTIPDRWFADMGDGLLKTVAEDAPFCNGRGGQVALNDLVKRLGVTSDGQPVAVAVIRTDIVNAVTLPGGRVVIFDGLLQTAEDGDQVAGVLAHELGHVQHRHVTQNLLRQFGALILLGQVGYAPGGDLAGAASNIGLLSYSRDAEREADRSGIEMLRGAGLRADGLSRFFALLSATPDGEIDSLLPSWIKTHPDLAERRNSLADTARGMPAFTDGQWQELKNICRSTTRQFPW